MANQQGNFGFRPVQMLGAAYNGQGQQELTIASNRQIQFSRRSSCIKCKRIDFSMDPLLVLSLLVFLTVAFYTDPTTSKPTFSNHYPGAS